MKKRLIFLFWLLLIFFSIFFSLVSFAFVSAQSRESQNFSFGTREAKFSMIITNTIQSNASKILVNLTFFPRIDDRQQVNFETFPRAEIFDDSILFDFTNKTGLLNFGVEADITTKLYLKKIDKDIALANLIVPAELREYVKDSRYIIIDPYIKNKARQLATKNAVETLYNLAEYVRRSMNYSVIEIKNSSWIMENKQGVCSHYTILFMALARSLGLPARFVSGVAYSNKDNRIREHAWAEVWLNGEWVPYDVTFGEYGWLDASHIVLKRSVDVSSSVEYSYLGNIEIGNLTINTSVVEASEALRLPLEMEAFVYRDKIAINSYVPLEVTVKNPNNYYIAVPVHVSVAPGVFGESEKIVLLGPGGESKVLFNIHIPELPECERECIATLAVEDFFGNNAETTLLIGRDYPRMSLEESENLIKVYSKIYGWQESTIDFYCKADKDFYYDYENVSVVCYVRSPRDARVSICNQNVCENRTLLKDYLEQVHLEIPSLPANKSLDTIQMQCLTLCIITREQKDVVAISCVDTKILAAPEVNVSTIEGTEARYGVGGKLRLYVNSNVATSATLLLDTGKYQESYPLFLEKGTNIIPIEIATWKLDIGNNPFLATLTYEDKNNKSYSIKRNFVFTVKNVSIFEKLLVKLSHLFG